MDNLMQTYKQISMDSFDYPLPDERIAKYPKSDREMSKLLLYKKGDIVETKFTNAVEEFAGNELLVFNNTKVIHARLFFRKTTGALIEIFCLEPKRPADYACNFAERESCEWSCLVGNLKKWKSEPLSTTFQVDGEDVTLSAERGETNDRGEVTVKFSWSGNISFAEVLEACGRIPIPPYLNRDSEQSDNLRYQTVYSKFEGSVAAPTAGLHFTERIIAELQDKGVVTDYVTLHVGAGTFKPVKAENIGGHDMHTEHIVVNKSTVENIYRCAGNIVAVGTTSVRTLESLYWMGVKCAGGVEEFNYINQWEPYELPQNVSLKESMEALLEWFNREGCCELKASTTIIIVPGYKYRVVDRLFTNFHQPHSTLLLLVAAAIGDDWKKIYNYALEHDFRFLSYGDSNLINISNREDNV